MDIDGFTYRLYDSQGHRYTTQFLVRELGYVKFDPKNEYVAESYHFNLRGRLNMSKCPPEVKKTLNYQSKNVVCLSIFPGNDESVVDYKDLEDLVQRIYQFCCRSDANVVAYKGGEHEKELLDSLKIPCLDLQGFACPKYEDLINLNQVYSSLQECGYHTRPRKGVLHCPKMEVTAYKDWLMLNHKSYSTAAFAEPEV
ncbi:uncharacterized protein CEXT_125711 [Caerostris extrusa]|uniref:Uncharacterized protein n=1 Tax=Caerostris extrusa TaxID=172846 RepID=A0AAV4MB09_CAEEX|nr:uncharacterized protein CEXT_125711 [Caerostris extrusa]